MLKNLLAVKSVQDLEAESAKGELRRTLGAGALTAIGIAALMCFSLSAIFVIA